MRISLQTRPHCVDLFVGKEHFATYTYLPQETPGFLPLHAPGGRAVLRPQEGSPLALWVGHDRVEEIGFGPGCGPAEGRPAGRIVSEELIARRGAHSVGFRHVCRWLDPAGRALLTDARTVRVSSGPCEGRVLDLVLELHAPQDRAVTLSPGHASLLRALPAKSLCPAGGGQIRSSIGAYGLENIDRGRAAWVACVGVVESETVGVVLLEHPENPGSPTCWRAAPDGLLSPFALQTVRLAAGRILTLRYRVYVHRGYVDAGWADARLQHYVSGH